MPKHTQFATVSRGLNRNGLPMRLFEKAKRLGIWNPSALDLSQDRADWLSLDDGERDLILRLCTLFQAGEEAVTLDLLPLMLVIAQEGRIEEELFLTSFLWEEAKHTDFFRRFLDEVVHVGDRDLSRYHTPSYHVLFYETLPTALGRLLTDRSPLAQAEASLTYNMIVEGTLAETGYHAFFTMLEKRNLMPGTREGIRLLKQDESRHIAYGIHLLARLIAEHEGVWEHIETRIGELIPQALGVIDEAFAAYEVVPFALKLEDFTDYAFDQFQRRLARLELARTSTLAELEGMDEA